MPDSTQLEFTGERVVPGLVDPNLFNEHLARYRFAALFASGRSVLDAGCGSGYGVAELDAAGAIVAMDIAAEAVAHASRAFAGEHTRFLQGRCEALPFRDGSFDLVVAFEVIEHLAHWQQLLSEARRVLRPDGVLLVSTPNKSFYEDSRAKVGPNPFHIHEFEFAEFEAALLDVFPHVHLWAQNHSEVITFVPRDSSRGIFEAPADEAAAEANFFLAACSQSAIPFTSAFGWLAHSGNVLHEREKHICLLEDEVTKKNAWLADAQRAQSALQGEYDKLASHHAAEVAKATAVIAGLRDELASARTGYEKQIAKLEQDAATRLEWVTSLEEQIARGNAEISRQREEIAALGNLINERTEWAQSLEGTLERERRIYREREAELQDAQAQLAQTVDALERTRTDLARVTAELAMSDNSKWVRLGRSTGAMFPKP